MTKTIKIADKLDKEQTEIITNIIHDVLVDLGHGENLDFYAWDLDVDLENDWRWRHKESYERRSLQ